MRSNGDLMALVIGYGNPLRSDDGLGPYLAERLAQAYDILTPLQLTPELAEPISRAGRVVFIDAATGDTPGEVVCVTVEPAAAEGAFTHHVTPASLLAAARELYGAAPEGILITVTAASFAYGSDFSAPICAQLPRIVRTVRDMVRAYFNAPAAEYEAIR